MKNHSMQSQAHCGRAIKRRIIFTALVLVTVGASQYAAMAQEAPALQFSGFLRVENFTYLKGFDPRIVDNGRNQIKFLLKGQSELSSALRMSSSVEFRYDEVNSERNRTTIKEAFLEYSLNSFDFRVGKQIYSWGRADEVNPTNNINPVDYSDLLDTDEEEIGVISCSGKYYLGDATFQGIVAPTLVPNKFPAMKSRWNLFPAAVTSMQVRKPSNELKNWQRAFRVSSSLSGWDFSVSYFGGFDAFPAVFVQPDPVTNSLAATLDYRKLQVFGADVATTFDKLGVRGEVGYFRTDDPDGVIPEVSDPYLQYVLGVDYTFTDVAGDQDWFILAQWIQEVRLPEYAGGEFSENDLRHFFQRTVMLKTEWRFSEFGRFGIQGFWRVKASDYYVQPKFSADVADGLNIEFGMDVLLGKSGSLLSQLQDNRRVFGKATYRF